MSKAFIGASTPLGYNYKVEKVKDHPNPILDAPIGLFLFYDEIWFLDEKALSVQHAKSTLCSFSQ